MPSVSTGWKNVQEALDAKDSFKKCLLKLEDAKMILLKKRRGGVGERKWSVTHSRCTIFAPHAVQYTHKVPSRQAC